MIQEDLILLNIDSRCEGTYTWQRGEQKSAIDLIMVNQCGYKKFEEMEVNEKREIYDLSDHCMVRITQRGFIGEIYVISSATLPLVDYV